MRTCEQQRRKRSNTGSVLLVFVLLTGAAAQSAPATSSRAEGPFHVLSLEGAMRYAYADASPGHVLRRQLEYRGTASVRLDMWHSDATFVQVRAQTGAFQTAFSATDVGLARENSKFSAKSLFLGQRIGPRIEVEVGGIEYEYGAGSEATYGSSAGWMTGYRVRVRGKSEGWWPASVSATFGYVGDFDKPNFVSRSSRMGDFNYVQLVAQKSFSKNMNASTEFDSLDGIGMVRNALLWKRIPVVVMDEAQVEGNIRASDYVDLGWAATAKRHLLQRRQGTLALRYSQIPRDFFVNREGRVTMLNGGEIGLGKRGAMMASMRPSKAIELGCLVSRRIDSDPLNKRWRALAYASYDFRELANRILK